MTRCRGTCVVVGVPEHVLYAHPVRQPSVTVIVVNSDGKDHLEPCLDSIAALDYPEDLVETVVVDNGSTDGSLELLAGRRDVRILPLNTNAGFAEGVNTGAHASSADCIALVNNDMRVEPGWLRELVALYDPDGGYPCVAGLIVDWEGNRVDFVDGYVNFHGAGMQDRFGEPLEQVDVIDRRDLLFACGGSMLIDRGTFLRVGGFDPRFFAYVEDVDLGWRLWLSGHRVRLAAAARSFHRHHGTSSRFTSFQREFLLERNTLRMLFKNAEHEHLDRLLAASLFLLVERARVQSGTRRTDFDPGADAAQSTVVPMSAIAPLQAVGDVLHDLDGLIDERARVQALRRTPDAEIFPLFRRPFTPVRTEHGYLEAMGAIRRAFDLERLFAKRRATRLVFVPGTQPDRLWSVAERAARFVSVGFVGDAERRSSAVERVTRTNEALGELLAEADVVVVDRDGLDVAEKGRGVLVVADHDVGDELRAAADMVITADEDGVESLRGVVEEPWRWHTGRRPDPASEELQVLLARWRREYGVSRGRSWRLGRALWELLPARARALFRRGRAAMRS